MKQTFAGYTISDRVKPVPAMLEGTRAHEFLAAKVKCGARLFWNGYGREGTWAVRDRDDNQLGCSDSPMEAWRQAWVHLIELMEG